MQVIAAQDGRLAAIIQHVPYTTKQFSTSSLPISCVVLSLAKKFITRRWSASLCAGTSWSSKTPRISWSATVRCIVCWESRCSWSTSTPRSLTGLNGVTGVSNRMTRQTGQWSQAVNSKLEITASSWGFLLPAATNFVPKLNVLPSFAEPSGYCSLHCSIAQVSLFTC